MALRLAMIGVVDEEQGSRLASSLRAGQRLVSRNGDLWRWDGFVARAEAKTPAAIRLEQRTHLHQLEKDLAVAADRANSAAETHQAAQQEFARCQSIERDARALFGDARRSLDAARARQVDLEREHERATQRLVSISEAMTLAETDRNETNAELSAAREEKARLPDASLIAEAVGAAREASARARSEATEARAAHNDHVTGLEVGKQISYFYYPLEDLNQPPKFIGSFNGKEDSILSDLLTTGKKEKKFVAISSSEHFHAINVLSRFSSLSSILEVCRYVQDDVTKNDLSSDDFQEIFLDNMVSGLFDLKSLGSSFEGANTLVYRINGSVKGIDGYIKKLIDEIRSTLKKNDLKASRTKIALSWTLDQHEMRGDKIEMLQNLTSRLRDYIGDVEAYEHPNFDLFHSDKTTIIVACSKLDFENIEKNKQDSNIIVIKANPLCEIIQ